MKRKIKEMDRRHFKTYADLSRYMIETSEEDTFIVATLFYEDAIELMHEILKDGDIVVEAIEIKPEIYNGYNREYYVSLSGLTLSIEPAYSGNRYLRTDADIMLLEGSVSSEILPYVDIDNCVEISIGINYDYDYEDDIGEDDIDDYEYKIPFDSFRYVDKSDKSKVSVLMDTDVFIKTFI